MARLNDAPATGAAPVQLCSIVHLTVFVTANRGVRKFDTYVRYRADLLLVIRITQTMATVPVLYRCPNTGFRVQGYTLNESIPPDHDSNESVTCLACKQAHLVNFKTGKVLCNGGKVEARLRLTAPLLDVLTAIFVR